MIANKTLSPPRSKKAEPGREAPPWWRHAPVKDSQTIDWLPGRLVKLRAQLRNLYWSNLCRPLAEAEVAALRKRLAQAEGIDAVNDTELSELVTPLYGFEACPEGWRIPELDDHLAHAVAENQRASARGLRGAEGRWGKRRNGAESQE